MPAPLATASIALLWFLFGEQAALISALTWGLLLDSVSFETPFGLFLGSYGLSTWLGCRLNRFFFQSPFVTFLLFVLIVGLSAPLIETLCLMVSFQTTHLPLESLQWNIGWPACLDIGLAALLGLPVIYFLLKRRALR